MSNQRAANLLQHYSLGLKLRSLRNEKHLTLSRLAAETGLSTALLSKLETERLIPTLSTLARLCQIYGVGLGYFFSDGTAHSLAITRKACTPARRRENSSTTLTHLHVPSAQGRMIATILELPPGLTSTLNENARRKELFAYVLDGCLQITIAGVPEVLEAGDCAAIDTEEFAAWNALGESGCRVLSISARTPPE